MLYWLTIAATSIGIFVYLLTLFNQRKNGRPINKYHAAWLNIGLGLVLLLLAGWPFWLTDISLGLEFPADRFTISFMLGSSILIAGLLYAIPIRNWVKYLLLAVLVGLAAGKQMEASIYYTRDWNIQKNFFWQLTWRMPQLKPGTVIVANDLPFRYTTDNSLSGPLNYIFAPDNHSDKMDYILYYPTLRLGSGLPRLVKDQPIKQNYLAAYFEGSTSQLVAIYYDYETCLRVLDPEVDANNWLIPDIMRSAAKISTYDVILPVDASQAVLPPMNIYGEEPPHQWCYYLQKADLARQQGQWEEIARLGDEAFKLGDYPNGPSERIPFIEGYAHVGNWEKAIELTRITNDISPLMKKSLCPLWQRIEDEVPNNPDKTSTIATVSSELGCE